ncbi:hypothetical protein [Flagellimonas sp. 2504JD4-2]
MKKLILPLLLSLSVVVFAQQGNNDILFTKSGDIIQGKVVKVTKSTISFSYPGETLVNELDASNLQKIVFSSGRTQSFGGAATSDVTVAPPLPSTSTTEENVTTIPKEEIYLGPNFEENRLAVIPLSFFKNGTYDKDLSGQMTKFATDYLARQNQSLPINVQDMSATIKALVDAGIRFSQLSDTPVNRLQNVLRAEYVVLMEVNEKSVAKESKKSGFFEEAQITEVESGLRYDIELVLYGGLADEKYSTKFSDERTFSSSVANSNPEVWKTAVQYVLNQVLTSGNL